MENLTKHEATTTATDISTKENWSIILAYKQSPDIREISITLRDEERWG